MIQVITVWVIILIGVIIMLTIQEYQTNDFERIVLMLLIWLVSFQIVKSNLYDTDST